MRRDRTRTEAQRIVVRPLPGCRWMVEPRPVVREQGTVGQAFDDLASAEEYAARLARRFPWPVERLGAPSLAARQARRG